MPKYRACFQMTYEALAKWLGLPADVTVISVNNDQLRETASFYLAGPDDSHCVATPEGFATLVRQVDSKEMIAPVVDKEVIFKIGKFQLVKVSDDPQA